MISALFCQRRTYQRTLFDRSIVVFESMGNRKHADRQMKCFKRKWKPLNLLSVTVLIILRIYSVLSSYVVEPNFLIKECYVAMVINFL